MAKDETKEEVPTEVLSEEEGGPILPPGAPEEVPTARRDGNGALII